MVCNYALYTETVRVHATRYVRAHLLRHATEEVRWHVEGVFLLIEEHAMRVLQFVFAPDRADAFVDR